jgi:hypothetical protein
VIEHIPDRPSWDCRVCGKPWPCDPSREALRIEYLRFPTVLRMYLAQQMTAAIVELHHVQPGEFHERFLAWSR